MSNYIIKHNKIIILILLIFFLYIYSEDLEKILAISIVILAAIAAALYVEKILF